MTHGSNRTYPVGYGKPPVETRFKPGQSGNPKGRPKKVKDLARLFMEELGILVQILENGEKTKITKQRALVRRAINKGLEGDLRALTFLFQAIDLLERKVGVGTEDDIVDKFQMKPSANEEEAARMYQEVLAEVNRRAAEERRLVREGEKKKKKDVWGG